MGRRAKDPEIRKKEFIDAALELFGTKGFDQTSVTDITDKVGVSHGAFFYYYRSKDDLMQDVVDRLHDMNYQVVKGLADDRKMTAKEKLKAILNRSIGVYTTMSSDKFTEYFHRASNLSIQKKYAKQSREKLNPLFVKIAEQGIREGYCEIKYPRETIEYLSYVFEGLDDAFSEPQSNEEYYRKIRALELIVIKALGIKDADLGLIG